MMGDWNGRIGDDRKKAIGCMGRFGTEGVINQNGKRMIHFCITNDLRIGNTFYNHGEEPQYTYESEDGGNKSLVDYITFNNSLELMVKDIWVEDQAELGTDHKLVIVEVEDGLKQEKASKEFSQINVHRLRSMEVRRRYQEEIERRLSQKTQESQAYQLDEMWRIFKEITISTAKKICGVRRFNEHRKSTKWWNDRVKGKIREKKRAWKNYIETGKVEDRVIYKQKRDEAKTEVNRAKVESWEDFGREMEANYKTNQGKFWRTIKKLRGHRREKIWNIEDKNKDLKTETEDILEVWNTFYGEKFGCERIQEEDEVEDQMEVDQEITQDEIQLVIKALKTDKAPGKDEIASELIKWGGLEMEKWVTQLIRKSWTENRIPEEWEENIIIPLYKKGNKSNCENYRAICLTSTLYKMYTKIIEGRLRGEMEGKMEKEQAAYMKGKQTQDHISIVRKIIERAKEQGKELCIAFVDLKAAFDTVPRDKLWSCLKDYKISSKLLKAVKTVYKRVRGEVRIDGKSSNGFEMHRGIKQGDSLSPLLFNIYMDHILKTCKENLPTITVGYMNMTRVQVQSLLYADDIILMSDNREKMQTLINKWDVMIQQKGMQINTSKTKIIMVNGMQHQHSLVKCGQDEIEEVSTMDYLGTKVSEDGKIETEILSRIRMTAQMYYQLNKTFLGKKEISNTTKTRIYNSIVVPRMTYGCETWPLTKNLENKLRAAEMRYMRKIAGKTRWDKCHNIEILDSLKQKPITVKIEEKQLKWYGHVQRMEPDSLTRRVVESKRIGGRKAGRPRMTMEQRIQEIATKRHKNIGELRVMAKDRKNWRRWVETPVQPTP